MNDRINELIEQSTIKQPVYPAGCDGHPEYNIYFDTEKFADLIINECIAVCMEQRDPSNLNYKPSVRMAEAIRQHFGR